MTCVTALFLVVFQPLVAAQHGATILTVGKKARLVAHCKSPFKVHSRAPQEAIVANATGASSAHWLNKEICGAKFTQDRIGEQLLGSLLESLLESLTAIIPDMCGVVLI